MIKLFFSICTQLPFDISIIHVDFNSVKKSFGYEFYSWTGCNRAKYGIVVTVLSDMKIVSLLFECHICQNLSRLLTRKRYVHHIYLELRSDPKKSATVKSKCLIIFEVRSSRTLHCLHNGAKPPIYLHWEFWELLIFSSLKYPVWWTGFFP